MEIRDETLQGAADTSKIFLGSCRAAFFLRGWKNHLGEDCFGSWFNNILRRQLSYFALYSDIFKKILFLSEPEAYV